MERDRGTDLLSGWLTLSQIQMNVSNELEAALQNKHQLSLNEFYMLLFLYEAPDKKLRLQQLESMIGLSQSALSRLVSRFEAKGCGALRRYVCENDRRGVYTSLTPLGVEKLEKALSTFQSVLMQQFSKEEIQSSLQYLVHMNE
ncbi:MarR family winged helix-turn-helix transcriptional regulator [Paenibacillus sp. GCM10027626]|uniref:MarR family winged helix-turn-helix transcriptional regulator n=1 Tax=Paenibacillus sp. GCM10027626 TaxID=3273411 RepID=UPI00363100DC